MRRGIGLVKANQGLAQCRILRDARMAMGLTVTHAASGADWVWAKPDRQETAEGQLAETAERPAEQNIQTAGPGKVYVIDHEPGARQAIAYVEKMPICAKIPPASGFACLSRI